jgi:hypothetical protein
MNRHSALYVIPFLLAACASSPPDDSTATAKPQNCEREYRIGSYLPTKDCAPALTAAERQRMLDELRTKVRPGTTAPPGSGG